MKRAVLYYRSAWDPAYIHMQSKSRWESYALHKCQDHYGWQTIEILIPHGGRQFVLTDGYGKWDNPAPYCRRKSGKNYFLNTGGRYAIFKGELVRIRSRGYPILLVSDIDGTIIEHNQVAADAVKVFYRYWIKNYMFNGSKLVYNTGRTLEGYEMIASEGFDIPSPDFLVTNFGAYVYQIHKKTGKFILDVPYIVRFRQTHWQKSSIEHMIDNEFPFCIKPNVSEHPYNICRVIPKNYFGSISTITECLRNVSNREYEGHVLKAQVVQSQYTNQSQYHILDIVPVEAGKGAAMRYCQEKLGFHAKNTVAVGNSSNDLHMIESDSFGILVENSTADLLDWYNQHSPENKMHSKAKYALAIVDGLEVNSRKLLKLR